MICNTCAIRDVCKACELIQSDLNHMVEFVPFDKKLGEVIISEAKCVGCTLCAQACPYSAIEMVDIGAYEGGLRHYVLVAYDPGPNPKHIVSGIITTDGSLGSGLDPTAAILDYTATLSDGTNTNVINFASDGLLGLGATITATPIELTLDAGTDSAWCLSATC